MKDQYSILPCYEMLSYISPEQREIFEGDGHSVILCMTHTATTKTGDLPTCRSTLRLTVTMKYHGIR